MTFIIHSPKSIEEREPRFIYERDAAPPSVFRKTIEFERYKDREKKRWLEGYMGLTPQHYYHLTRGRIKHGTGGTTIRPLWRESDEFVFGAAYEAMKIRHDFYGVKRREYGWSVIFGACFPNWFVSTNIGCDVSMTSSDKPKTSNLFSNKFIPFYDNIDKDFELGEKDDAIFQPVEIRRNETMTTSYLKITGIRNGQVEKSQIICPETVTNSSALSSYRVKYLFVDEWALHDKVDQVIRSADDALNTNGVRDGFFAAGGTVESEIPHENLKKIQKLLSLKQDQLKLSKKSVIFIEAWRGRQLYEGEDGEVLYIPGTRNGWDNEKFATEIIMRKRDAYIAADDEKGLNAYIKNHPLTIQEVMSAVGTGTLPADLAEKVSKQKRHITLHDQGVIHYDLKEQEGGKIVAEVNDKSPIVIYKMPDPTAPAGTYIAGNDPIPYGNNDIGSGSMDSFVIKNILTQEYVAYYMERNLDPHYVNYKKVLLQRFYGNAKSMLEQNRGELVYRHYVDHGLLHLLARKPAHFGLKMSNKHIQYGVFRNEVRLIDLGNSLFYDYIRNHIEKFMFEVGLEQMLSFDPKNVNNDMVDAIIWCEILNEEIRRRNKKQDNQEDIEEITIPIRKMVNGKIQLVFQKMNIKKQQQ